jgi:hypothetical protein
MSLRTWESGLPSDVRRAIEEARAGRSSGPDAWRLLRFAGRLAEEGQLPGMTSQATRPPLRPDIQIEAAARYYALAERVKRRGPHQ